MSEILNYLIDFGAVNGGFAFTVLMVSAFYYIFFIVPRLKKVAELEELNEKLQRTIADVSVIKDKTVDMNSLCEIAENCDDFQKTLLNEIMIIKNELTKIDNVLDKILFFITKKD